MAQLSMTGGALHLQVMYTQVEDCPVYRRNARSHRASSRSSSARYCPPQGTRVLPLCLHTAQSPLVVWARPGTSG